ncbi:hypothetical protein [Williamsia sterculiae]|uniref:Uncharacterized protein n=1 Tax=Williamsia sterculiae TaxID=1344003 RepID=A0A1N7HCP5_9NOCA|nr:hypothetical protein [Williamsia sterculiae]SIS22450.1 hypothetical protein SAMN05445060_3952 [Williamsia sterculiae]
MSPTSDPADRDLRAARRAVIRANHPDVGGDPATLRRELDRLASVGGQAVPGARPRALRRRAAIRVRTLRAKLPRGCPGAKRYVDL